MSSLPYFKQLRSRCARPVGDEVLHGDLCPKLTLHGVDFCIPPRGLRVEPVFDGDGRTGIRLRSARDSESRARSLLKLAPLQTRVCRRCGQSVGGHMELEGEGGKFLAACFDLAGRLLRRQYDLTDDQLADLLAFDTDQPPVWIAQLLAWAAGLPVDRLSAEPTEPARSGWIRRLWRAARRAKSST